MVFYPREVPQGTSSRSEKATLDAELARDCGLAGPVDCELSFDRSGGRIRVSVEWDCTVAQDCARCAESFDLELSGSFEALVVPESETVDEENLVYRDETEKVDLGNVLYEEILTSVPLMPLCRQDCKGVLGVEQLVKIDPRWSALGKLKSGN